MTAHPHRSGETHGPSAEPLRRRPRRTGRRRAPTRGAPDTAPPDTAPPGATLYLMHGLEGAGVLTLPLRDSAKLPVVLNPALVRLLCAMHRARKKDKDQAPQVRGWRAAERLGKDVAKLLRFAPAISAQAVTKYVWEINREIRLAAEKRGPGVAPPAIIESRRGWGYRLAVEDLTIIDRSEDA